MEPISRRNALRLTSGAVGTTVMVGGSLIGAPNLLSSAAGASSKKIRAKLNRETYETGQRMVLRIDTDLKHARKIRVIDSSGVRWKRVKKGPHRQKWTAVASRPGSGTVRVRVERPNGRFVGNTRYRARVDYRVTGRSPIDLAGGTLIGMSAPAALWDERVAQVGPGLAARRIFGDLADGASSQMKLVAAAHAAGMLPVVSYKVGGDAAGAASGRFDAVAEQAAANLASFGLPTAVAIWHEPNPDITGAEFAAIQRRLLPIFKRAGLRVGPILNGWLLDNQQDLFASYCPDDLFDLWDWVGIDTYEAGTAANPGKRKPADRIPALRRFVTSRGSDLPLGVGEYNGFSGETIAATGEALLSTPNVWFGCLWNATGDKGFELTGDRLAAFQASLADSRSAEPRTGSRVGGRHSA